MTRGLSASTEPVRDIVDAPRAPTAILIAEGGDPPLSRYDEVRLRAALVELARGLHALHAAGTVHRDVQPSRSGSITAGPRRDERAVEGIRRADTLAA